jgi:hypothetical protein
MEKQNDVDERKTTSAPSPATEAKVNTSGVGDGSVRVPSGLYEQARTAAGETYSAVTEKATNAIEERKNNISDGLSTVARSVRSVNDELRSTGSQNRVTEITADLSESFADKLENVARYFQRKDLRTIVGDAERLARQNPGIFIAGAFAVGLLAARFLKSSAPGRTLAIGNSESGTRPPKYNDASPSVASQRSA